MTDVPPDTPVTTPEPLTVAIAVELLFHVPPPPSLNAVAEPAQTNGVPVIDDAPGFTVTFLDAEQPVDVMV